MEPLDPFVALAGGLLIGTAAALLLLLSGRIAGVSGMLARATGIADSGPRRSHALAFVLGLPIGAVLIAGFVRAPDVIVTSSIPLIIAGGLLVGFGTRLGNGCTSGHGVCGMARLSPRSIAATATFMAAGFLLVGVMRHVIGA
ncbi:YeeE/YedE family protein [Allopontixanthobacter sediminis]|uniref:YeeE/YedE family protein n=1 Tax=Allopontixanthobacter sediminis TaxID=1689985 RepID=A0A845B3H7_9SPHN|nr:YeeE/YedE thiosulfate transporter family protein [Allopontixanthobacter sediminis]MXP44908.1 YeeE/YedE family protein [Allopontixanthobacter sediminis]